MKNQMIMQGMAILFSLTLINPASADSDSRALEREVQKNSHRVQTRSSNELQKTVQALRRLQESPEAMPAPCSENHWTTFGGKYAMSMDASTGTPCRIYDLSFPTVKTYTGKIRVSQIPVERFTAKDYLNWIRGNYDQVYKKVIDIRSNFKPDRAAQASWVSQLKFKPGTPAYAMMNAPGKATLPPSFYASDLQVGAFQLPAKDREQLKELIAQVQGLTQPMAPMSADLRAWQEAVDHPETFLEKIRFDWNDFDKVYDVLLEGEFIPLNGPIALVDYQAQYKYAVESLLRGAVGSVLRSLAYMIPNIAARNLIYVAVNDSLEFIDMMYASQLAQLEDTLRAGLNQQIHMQVESPQIQTGLNILFGSGSALFSEYILSLAQGQEFNWQQMDELGRMARYREEKTRNVNLANLNSRLVLERNCDVERIHTYFAVCSQNGKKNAIYSLMTNQQILIWNPGAPLVHRFDRPSEVLLKRATTWLLSAGLRVFDLPYVPHAILRSLGYLVQDYAQAGIVDEAYLKNHLWIQKRLEGTLSPENEKLLTWLYYQNINPFLPKTEQWEQNVIEKNAALLGLPAPTLQKQGGL